MKLSFYLHKYHNYDRDRIQVKTRRVTKKLVTLLSFAYLKDSFIYLNKKDSVSLIVSNPQVSTFSFSQEKRKNKEATNVTKSLMFFISNKY